MKKKCALFNYGSKALVHKPAYPSMFPYHTKQHRTYALSYRYKELKAKSPSGKVDRESMQLLFASSVPPMPPALLERIFSALDLNSNGVIDTREFVNGLSIACRGTADEKVSRCKLRGGGDKGVGES